MNKHRNIKLVTTETRRNNHTTKFFKENLLVIKMRKTQILMNKLVYLGLLILDQSKTLICEFWYNYVKPKYYENAKPFYRDTDSFVVHV